MRRTAIDLAEGQPVWIELPENDQLTWTAKTSDKMRGWLIDQAKGQALVLLESDLLDIFPEFYVFERFELCSPKPQSKLSDSSSPSESGES